MVKGTWMVPLILLGVSACSPNWADFCRANTNSRVVILDTINKATKGAQLRNVACQNDAN